VASWKPIADLTADERAWTADDAAPEAEALRARWHARAEGPSRRHAEQRLERLWAIETGIIEGVYQIDRGITEQLVEHGIDAALIPHGMATPSGEYAARVASTHFEVLEGLFAFVKGERLLSTSYVKELHAAITREQADVEGIDALGRRAHAPLVHGEYKRLPNNPTRRNGSVHEYAPPIHVAAEMERLVEMNVRLAGVHPIMASAWLHHRLTQVHPFQDGNGRVARALATITLLRGGWLPMVVRREQRADYIAALESADAGNLSALADLMARFQAADLAALLASGES